MERPSSIRCGIKPEICPSYFALSIKVANISTTRLKSNGNSRSPYLKPFFVSKNLPTPSFTLMPTLPFEKNDLIHLHHFSLKPFDLKVCWRKDQLILSYAFSKSSFRIAPFILFLWSSCMVSCKNDHTSKIYLPGMKADWLCRTILSAIPINLLAITFLKILKLH